MVKMDEIERFSIKITEIVEQDKISYLDAITEYCESIGLEVEIAAKLLSPVIKAKIEEEALNYNLIEKHPVLEFEI